jgi:hypothetical protein
MKFTTEPNQLTIRLEGLEQLWALRRRLQIPHYAIEDIDYVTQYPVMRDLYGYIRLPGTSLPGIFLAGSYRRKGEREFWYLKMRRQGVMTIYLKPEALAYDKVRVTCTPRTAQRITDWWQNER